MMKSENIAYVIKCGDEGIDAGTSCYRKACSELSKLTGDLAAAVDILAALDGYGVALPDEAYTLIETYHGKL
jgi:hypothetical protein